MLEVCIEGERQEIDPWGKTALLLLLILPLWLENRERRREIERRRREGIAGGDLSRGGQRSESETRGQLAAFGGVGKEDDTSFEVR